MRSSSNNGTDRSVLPTFSYTISFLDLGMAWDQLPDGLQNTDEPTSPCFLLFIVVSFSESHGRRYNPFGRAGSWDILSGICMEGVLCFHRWIHGSHTKSCIGHGHSLCLLSLFWSHLCVLFLYRRQACTFCHLASSYPGDKSCLSSTKHWIWLLWSIWNRSSSLDPEYLAGPDVIDRGVLHSLSNVFHVDSIETTLNTGEHRRSNPSSHKGIRLLHAPRNSPSPRTVLCSPSFLFSPFAACYKALIWPPS